METNGRINSSRIQLPGATISFRVDEPAYELADASIRSGFSPTPHVHRVHHEMFLVVDGQVDFLVGDETSRVDAGGFVDVPPGIVHDFHNPGPDTARLICLATPGGLRSYFAEIEAHVKAATLDADVLASLRTRYDTESVHVVWRVTSPQR